MASGSYEDRTSGIQSNLIEFTITKDKKTKRGKVVGVSRAFEDDFRSFAYFEGDSILAIDTAKTAILMEYKMRSISWN